MRDVDMPLKLQLPFGQFAGPGYIRAVPVPSQISVTPGAASFTDGFPPLTFIPEEAGGIPPFGQDMNGLLNNMSAWNRWACANGPIYYDGTWATSANVTGYPKYAFVWARSVANAIWINQVDNNTGDPDAGAPNWLMFRFASVSPSSTVRPWYLATKSNTVASPPATPADGDTYLVPVGATAGWLGQDNLVAIWSASLNAWQYVDFPTQGLVGVANIDDFYKRLPDGTWISIFADNFAVAFFLGMMGGTKTAAPIGPVK